MQNAIKIDCRTWPMFIYIEFLEQRHRLDVEKEGCRGDFSSLHPNNNFLNWIVTACKTLDYDFLFQKQLYYKKITDNVLSIIETQ